MAVKLKQPVMFHILPINKGLNYADPPQLIDMRETPATMGTHLYHGQLTSRFGYQRKYSGADEALSWMDVVYNSTGAAAYNICFSYQKAYYATAPGSGCYQQFIPVCYRDIAGTAYFDYYMWAPGTATYQARTPFNSLYIPLDSGTSKYFPIFSAAQGWGLSASLYCGYGNSGNPYPTGATSTSTAYANVFIFANPADSNVYIAIPGSGGSTIQIDTINDGSGNSLGAALMGGGVVRAIAMYDNRLLVGGGANGSQIIWSGKGVVNGFNFSTFSLTGGVLFPDSGSVNIADSPDWIQSMSRLGEYIVVYKERSIYLGKTTTNQNSAAIEFSAVPSQGVGLAAPSSVGNLGNEHLFLGWDNVYSFSLNGLTTVGDKVRDELFYGSNGIMPKYLNRALGVVAEEFDEYWLFIPTGRMADNWINSTNNDICNVAGYSGPNSFTSFPKPGGGNLTTSGYNPMFNYVGSFNSGAWGTPPSTPYLWSVSGTGATLTSGTNTAYPSSGFLGKYYAILTGSNTNQATMTGSVSKQPVSDTLGYNTGDLYSGIVWLQNPNASAVSVTFTMGNLSVTRSVPPTTVPVYIALSGIVTSGNTVVVQVTGPSAGSWPINIYGIQVCDIDMLAPGLSGAPVQHTPSPACLFKTSWNAAAAAGTSPNNDPNRLYLDGYLVPGYNRDAYPGDKLDGSYAPLMLPFIVDRVGSWAFDTVWCYNYKHDAWSIWRLPATGFGYDSIAGTMRISDLVGTVMQQGWRYDEKLIQTQAPTNLMAREDGQIYEMGKAYSYDFQYNTTVQVPFLNVPVYCEYESKDFDLGDPVHDKTLSRLTIHHRSDHPATVVQVSATADSGANWLPDQNIMIRNGFTETYCDFFVTGPQVRYRIKDNTGTIAFNGFSVKIVPRGESNAY